MNLQNIEVKSKLGKPASYTYRQHTRDSRTLAVIFPGQAYYKDSPLMWYSAISAFQAGLDTLSVEYGFHANRIATARNMLDTSIDEAASALGNLQKSKNYENVVFIAKSVGTVIAERIAREKIEGVRDFIFLTPLPQTVQFIRDAKNMLVVVGTSDPLFSEVDIAGISGMHNVSIVKLDGADHLLEVEGNYEKSLEYLRESMTACHNFCAIVNHRD